MWSGQFSQAKYKKACKDMLGKTLGAAGVGIGDLIGDFCFPEPQ